MLRGSFRFEALGRNYIGHSIKTNTRSSFDGFRLKILDY